jgi:hypothetical protein
MSTAVSACRIQRITSLPLNSPTQRCRRWLSTLLSHPSFRMFPFAHHPNPVRKRPRRCGIHLDHLNEEGSACEKAGKGCPAEGPFLEARTTCQCIASYGQMLVWTVRCPGCLKIRTTDRSGSVVDGIDQLLDRSLGQTSWSIDGVQSAQSKQHLRDALASLHLYCRPRPMSTSRKPR